MLPDFPLPATPSRPAGDDQDFDAENTPAMGNSPLEATSVRGTLVSVIAPSQQTPEPSAYTLRLTPADGDAFTLPFTGNVRIAEAQDGSLSVYCSDTGKTLCRSSQGDISEVDGDATADAADPVLVNTTGSSVRGGGRNTLIINFADNTTIFSGTGDTHILLADGVAGNTIELHGNAVIMGAAILQSTITLVGARNSLRFSGIESCVITLGDGSTVLDATLVRDTAITGGNGSNTLHLYALRGEGRLSLGHGDNHISVYELKDAATVRAGDGRNIIDMDEVADAATLQAGDGCNVIHIYQLRDDARVAVGNGDNDITLYEAEDRAELRAGDGRNMFRLYEIEDYAAVVAGDGHNSLQADTLRQQASVRCGHGANELRIRHMRNGATLEAGDGDNLVQILGVWDTSALCLGRGDNLGFVGARHAKAVCRAVGGMLHIRRKRSDEQALTLFFQALARRHLDRTQAGLPSAVGTPRDRHFPYSEPPRWRTPAMAGLELTPSKRLSTTSEPAKDVPSPSSGVSTPPRKEKIPERP